MRILVFGLARQHYGGIETYLLNMNEHMSPNTVFDYAVLAGNNSSDRCIHEERIRARGGRVFYLTAYGKNPAAYFRDMVRLLREFKKEFQLENGNAEQPAAYVNLFSMVHIYPALLTKLCGYRVVLHAHNNDMPQTNPLYRMLHYVNRALLGGMKATRVTISEPARRFMFGEHRAATLIYNAIDTERFRFNEQARAEVRKELGIDDGTTVVGFSGRLARQKNPLFLIDIFEEVHKRDQNTLLLVAGEGELRDDIERRIREKRLEGSVRLLGVRRDIERVYPAMDVFVLPSLFEGLGIVLIEAQAAGLNCVASADVIPKMSQMSEETLHFVRLSETPGTWADAVLAGAQAHNRYQRNAMIRNSRFNIDLEARRLEAMLHETRNI